MPFCIVIMVEKQIALHDKRYFEICHTKEGIIS